MTFSNRSKAAPSWFIVMLLAVVLLPIGLTNAQTSEGIGGRPANPDPDNPRTSSIFVYSLANGKTVDDGIRVLNNTTETKTVSVYAVDAVVSSDGAFACAQRVSPKASVGDWIKLETNSVKLNAMTSKVVDFRLTVPDKASVGEHNGCIAIEEADQEPVDTGNGVNLSFRNALRVAVTVPGDIKKGLELISLAVTEKDSSDGLVATPSFKNTGNVSLDTDVSVDLKNFFGVTVESQSGGFPILPGNTSSFNFDLKKPFWGGFYRVQATGTYNADPSVGIGEPGGQFETIASSPVNVFVAPQPEALAIYGIIAVLIVLGAVRWRNERQLHAAITKYTAKKGDTLQSIATKKDVSWRVIARINKLKAPYHLEPGDQIKVPKTQSK